MKTKFLLSAFFLWSAMFSYGQWAWEEANLSMAKSQMGVASLGSKVYFAGGYSWGTGVLETIETYDIETGVTTTDGNLSAARILPVGTTCGTRVFFAGGAIFPTTFFKQVDIYNSIMDYWDYDNLSEKRFALSAVAHGSKVLFAGGTNLALNQNYDIVDVYDTLTESWTTPLHLSLPRGVMGSAVVGDLAIFAGGFDNQAVFDRVDIYHFSTGTWDTATLSEARGFVSATTVGNKVLIAGGSTFDGTNWLLQDKIYLLSVGVGIDKKISEKESLRVYPNPCHDILKLQIPNDNTQNSLLANIYNMQRQMVFAKKLVNGNRNFNADLPSGIYLLKVVSADVLYTKLINIR